MLGTVHRKVCEEGSLTSRGGGRGKLPRSNDIGGWNGSYTCEERAEKGVADRRRCMGSGMVAGREHGPFGEHQEVPFCSVGCLKKRRGWRDQIIKSSGVLIKAQVSSLQAWVTGSTIFRDRKSLNLL